MRDKTPVREQMAQRKHATLQRVKPLSAASIAARRGTSVISNSVVLSERKTLLSNGPVRF